MRILIVSQYFWPESFVVNDLSCALAQAGHKITVVTGKPNYPTGKIWPGYTQAGTIQETYEELVDVFRVPLRPRGKAGALGLSLNYLSFMFSGLWHFPRLLKGKKFDVVFFFGVSPWTAAVPAAFLAWQKKALLAYWIQDLWPESLAATGFVTNRSLLWIVGCGMRYIYSRADILFLQSEAFEKSVSLYADTRKMHYLPNPAPADPLTEDELPPYMEAVFRDCFSVVFAGNIGRAQSPETIVKAAENLQGQKHIRLVVVGIGSEKDHMQKMITECGLENIVLLGHVVRKMMPKVFSKSGALLVTLCADPGLEAVVPSKIQAYMQAGKPIIAALNGEGARLVRDTGCGVTVGAQDADALAKAILSVSLMTAQQQEEMGAAGRNYFERHFEINSVSRKLIRVLEAVKGKCAHGKGE